LSDKETNYGAILIVDAARNQRAATAQIAKRQKGAIASAD